MASTPLSCGVARIVQQLIVNESFGTEPTAGADWATFYDNEPDLPDNCITVYGTSPVVDGRSLVDGFQAEHSGVQIRLRSKDYDVGAAKAELLRVQLTERVYNQPVTISGHLYIVHAFCGVTVTRAGRTSGTKRTVHTLNATLAVTARS